MSERESETGDVGETTGTTDAGETTGEDKETHPEETTTGGEGEGAEEETGEQKEETGEEEKEEPGIEEKEKEESKKDETETKETEGPQDVDTQYHEKDKDKSATSEKSSKKGSEKKEKKGSKGGSSKESAREKKPRKVYIMRHAERLDRIFPGWIKLAFADKKKYRPYDLNQPLTLPKRDNTPDSYIDDSPITEMGYVTAQMVGRGMRVTKTHFSAIYASPALRCIQTGHGLLKTLNANLKLRVEPGLFEWMGFYSSTPKWMTRKELLNANFQIDADYKPVMTEDELKKKKKESGKEHYDRIKDVIQKISKNNKDSGPILLIGHGTTVDAGSRFLLDRKTTDFERETLEKIGNHLPYCCVVGMEEVKEKQWKVIHNALPPISHSDRNNRIDHQFLNRKQ